MNFLPPPGQLAARNTKSLFPNDNAPGDLLDPQGHRGVRLYHLVAQRVGRRPTELDVRGQRVAWAMRFASQTSF